MSTFSDRQLRLGEPDYNGWRLCAVDGDTFKVVGKIGTRVLAEKVVLAVNSFAELTLQNKAMQEALQAVLDCDQGDDLASMVPAAVMMQVSSTLAGVTKEATI